MSPDDICEVCGTTRENHGDRKHKFSENGELELRGPTPKARMSAPKTKREAADDSARIERTLLKLVSSLVEKKVLDAQDLLYIFGATDGTSDRGSSEDGSVATDNEAGA